MRTGHYKESFGQYVALCDSPTVWAWIALLLAALLAAPLAVGAYGLTLMVSALIAVVGAVGLNVLTGATGLISLGQAGFLAVGAYTNGVLLVDYHWPLWATLPASGAVAALVSIIVGVPSLRLKGLYLAITTLAFSFIINHVILYAEGLTHGSNGIFVNGAKLFGVDVQRGAPLYYLTLGVAGALISLQIRFVNIDVFALILSIEALAFLILGGLGSIAGAILGAVFLSFLPEAIRLVMTLFGGSNPTSSGANLFEIRGMAYGVVIVVFLRWAPDGLIGLWRDIRKYWSNWPLAY